MQQHIVRFVQPKPDKCVWLLDDFTDVVDCDLAQAYAFLIRDTVHDHGHGLLTPCSKLRRHAMQG